MRVAFANTFDARGGAARAAFRLFTGVYGLDGVDAAMVVQETATGHPGVVTPRWGLSADMTSRLDARALKAAHPDRERTPFSVNRFPGRGASVLRGLSPDLVHMHWPHCGFIRIESLARLGVPIVWTIHDMWAFTGVCHYAGECAGYLAGCGACPLLASTDGDDVSASVFRRKASVYPKLDLTVVSPSNWLADLARTSPLLREKRVEVIPNGIDVDRFKPGDAARCRDLLGLPQGVPLILFGADFALADRRKGGGLLLDALAAGPFGDCELAVFGCARPDDAPDLPMRTHWLGPITDDDRLVAAYTAADAFVAPSLQENLSNTVMEALSCGVPVAAFDVGGMADLIRDGENGCLVPLSDGSRGLRAALDALFVESGLTARMGLAARESVVSRFELGSVARRYERLYRELL